MPVSLIRGGGKNVPGIPGACVTRKFTYLARGPWRSYSLCNTWLIAPRTEVKSVLLNQFSSSVISLVKALCSCWISFLYSTDGVITFGEMMTVRMSYKGLINIFHGRKCSEIDKWDICSLNPRSQVKASKQNPLYISKQFNGMGQYFYNRWADFDTAKCFMEWKISAWLYCLGTESPELNFNHIRTSCETS